MIVTFSHLRPRMVMGLVGLGMVAVSLAGCDGTGFSAGGSPADGATSAGSGSSASASPSAAADVEVSTNPGADASGVPVDTLVAVAARGGTLTAVSVSSKAGEVPGALGADKASWTASARLEPGTSYQVRVSAVDDAGTSVERTSSFTTAQLSLDQQTYASIAPLDGETVGVGMPVVVTFDVPVRDRAAFEKHMTVTSTPAQAGSWRWISSREAHWRPESYWQPGTSVKVAVDVNGVPAGGGIYGQEDRDIAFKVGDAHVYKVNAKTHQMKVFSNGTLLRTLPITTGKAGFVTRSGTKVIMEKFSHRRMNSETVGIARDSAEGYDLDDVRYAMRLTNSGEFIHAAPWSVGSQGRANVSHGCTGMSTANAEWLFKLSRRGDVVEYVGTDRPMEPTNGYGDWNIPYDQYGSTTAQG